MRALVWPIAAGALVALGTLAATLRRVRRDGRPRPLERADAILVLGAAIWPTGPSLTMRVRTARAAEVYAEGWAPVILCSGGVSGGVSEARTMRALLVESGVPADAIIADDGGATTREAIRSAQAFGAGRWRRVIAVSSSYHLHRIGVEARRQGLDVLLCPALRPGPRTARRLAFDARQHVRETIAVLAYACRARAEGASRHGPGRLLRAAARQVIGRTRSVAGGADAVTDASDVVGERIKSSVADFSDATTALTPAAAGLRWPVESAITSRFGLRHRRLHPGVDIRGAYGAPIRAAAGGVVLMAGWLGPYGNVAVVDHGGGLATVYAHQASLMVEEGASITTGQVLGYVGSTGHSSAPHLHFEVRVHGTPVDPVAYLS
jgi:vancomycin permeability regulator SanA